jgi:Icc protein
LQHHTTNIKSNCSRRNEKSYTQLLELTNAVKTKIFIIPGNHDDLDHLTKVLSKSNIFTIASQEPIKVGNWHFIYLNTVVKTENHGYLSDDCLRHFATNLSKTHRSNVCILMHHHPFDIGVPCVDKYKIRNAETMINTLTKNVKLVVYGHVHNDYTLAKEIIYTSCPSTCFQVCKNDKVDNKIYGFKEYVLSDNDMLFSTIWFTHEPF